jgi:DNA-binding NarL/FixJ family response regulator
MALRQWYVNSRQREGSMNQKIRVAILDDHLPVVEGYTSRLRNSQNIEVVGAVTVGEALEPFLAAHAVDVLLMDVVVPTSETDRAPYPILGVIPRLLQRYPALTVLVISMHNQRTLIRSVIEAGASGYILKDDRYFFQDLPVIIETVSHGGIYFSSQANLGLLRQPDTDGRLTARQLEALALCATYPEATTADLARKLGVANSTLRNLLAGAYMALEVHSRTAAVARAQQLGWITPAAPALDLEDLGGHGPARSG